MPRRASRPRAGRDPDERRLAAGDDRHGERECSRPRAARRRRRGARPRRRGDERDADEHGEEEAPARLEHLRPVGAPRDRQVDGAEAGEHDPARCEERGEHAGENEAHVVQHPRSGVRPWPSALPTFLAIRTSYAASITSGQSSVRPRGIAWSRRATRRRPSEPELAIRGAWAARHAMDDTFRRQWAIQLAQERAEQARAHRGRTSDEPARSRVRSSARAGSACRCARCSRSSSSRRRGASSRPRGGSATPARRSATRSRSSRPRSASRSSSAGAARGRSMVTPAGKVVVAHGRAVLKLLDNAEAQLAELARREQGDWTSPRWGGVVPADARGLSPPRARAAARVRHLRG